MDLFLGPVSMSNLSFYTRRCSHENIRIQYSNKWGAGWIVGKAGRHGPALRAPMSFLS